MPIIQFNKLHLSAALALVLVAGTFSCTKFNEWDTEEGSRRLFATTAAEASVEGVTVILSWKNMPATSSYVVEISQDSLVFGQILYTYEGSFELINGSRVMLIPDQLAPTTVYSARIKGKNSDGIAESNWTSLAFKTKSEQILLPFGTGDLAARTALLKWSSPNVTHLLLNGTRIDLTADEKEAQSKLLEGLTPKTAYKADIYNNTIIRGSLSFSTTAEIPTGPGVIVVDADANLATLIAGAADGTTFVLLEGTMYNADDAVLIPEGVSLTIWGEQGGVRPVLAFNTFTLPATAGTIRFENLDITGYQNNNSAGTKRNYIFNQGSATVTQRVEFENCVIRNLVNSPFRLQGSNAITINNVSFNNCVAYDIGYNATTGTYAFFHNTSATSTVNNISLTNSTLYGIGYSLILSNTTPLQSILIDNVTMDNIVSNTRYLVDLNAQNVTGSFIIRNTIVGRTASVAATARGIRVGSATTYSVLNSYQTADCIFSANPISNLTAYGKTSTELFRDPVNGDFIIIDNGFPGGSSTGDPRWRQ
ncbi:MAG: DUF5123 domain-containing protein [Candidatus Pseudobacter hemicellulosilyticus]|uniref:DUF5123 domain-containing protein n=1 Tax=Candidatus Pseudobacter hemicellulosilyticus TaxID=3121375 RepID=A0AAJ5WLT1_9BACT|nr:MAG: DUF5123 domain-containing protein [Pseudobacter sp.]